METAEGSATPAPRDPFELGRRDPDEITRAVRRKVLKAAAVAYPVMAGVLLVFESEGLAGMVLPLSILVFMTYLLGRAWLLPLRHEHMALPNPVEVVLEAGGLPAPPEGTSRTTTEHRLALRDALDRLGEDGGSFWTTRRGTLVHRVVTAIGVVGWAIAGAVAVVAGEWGAASICVGASGFFGGLGWLAERSRERRERAVDMLKDELWALPGSSE